MYHIFRTLIISTLLLSGAGAQPAAAQLTDRTLRIDYQFSGNKQQQHIAVSELLSNKGWAGRTVHLDSLPLKGNGDITLTDKRTGRTLYKQSFSTLFQEWLTTEEATRLSRSFENTFLLPMPVDTAEVTVQLYDFKHRVMTSLRHEVVPSDILIRNLDSHPVAPHRYLHRSGTPAEKIDVAIVAEGYTAEQADSFYADAQKAVDALLQHEPFNRYADPTKLKRSA